MDFGGMCKLKTEATARRRQHTCGGSKKEPVEMLLRHTQVGADKQKRLAILQDVVDKVEGGYPI